MTDRPIRVDQYDHLANDYDRSTEQNAYNAFCERPATLTLIGNVRGKAILDAACGSGFYAAHCEEHGAHPIYAFDGSPNMVALAKSRLSRATVFIHELASPLTPIAAETLDGVICALALEYTHDLNLCLREFSRILKPDGFLVFSIENPWLVYQSYGSNYWEQELVEHTSPFLHGVRGYRRPLSMYLNGLAETGFSLERIDEAQPVDRCRELFPEVYQGMMRIPFFLAIRARKAGR